MKQVLLRRGRIQVGEVPAPRPEPGCILVRTAYSLISAGTEISIIQNSTRSLVRRAIEHPDKALQVLAHLRQQGWRKTWEKVKNQMDSDTPIGYSCSGIVLGVGPEVEGYSVGDRVACGGAGFATHSEVVSVPCNLVVPVPEGCDLKSAASVTLGAIAMQGVRRADPRIGEVVVVIGLGLLGQITVQIL
ncbi:MAG: zinc-binding alcohol dehydrogenase, partial [Proteobacteria bacterium]|nr:zinc-binding alcohol dehydrogenase [Pseudomonadota bacterium]